MMRKYEGVWRKRQVLPCWILQFIAAGIYAALGALILAAARTALYTDKDGNTYIDSADTTVLRYVIILVGIILAFVAVTFLLNVIEIILYVLRRLNPIVVILFAIVKLLGWGVTFVFSIYAASQRNISVGDVILSLILVVTSLTQLIFGAKYTHLRRKGVFDGRDYKRAARGAEADNLNPNGYASAAAGKANYESYQGSNAGNGRSGFATPATTAGSYHDNPEQGVEMLPQRHHQ